MKILPVIILFLSALVMTGIYLQHRAPPTPPAVSPTVTVSPTSTPRPEAWTTGPSASGRDQPLAGTSTPRETSSPTPRASDLNSTVNAYRKANGRGTLSTNGDLCRIAATRLAQIVQAGSLDNHAGFQGQAASQKEFLHVGEILQYRDPPETNEWLVYTGWAGSGEHNAILSDPGWTHGCGARAGTFAVFIFGRK